ncbi:nitrate- and nitrite sensing domain-containing protein [Nocardia sp. NBC_00511]|uniref:nitrate- and nitrite sensing domain-containing protein n=1 Tax=Nocardia sp. NBC_00511 TaxID=2903591 RepID=UPI0030E0709F
MRRILLVSIALVVALLTVIIAGEVGRYRDTGDASRAVNLALAVQDLVHEVQRERGLTNGLLGGDTSARQAVANQRMATDSALRGLESALDAQPPGADPVRTALGQFSAVSANRADVDARRIDRSASFTFYTNAIAALNQTRPGPGRTQDTALFRGLQTLYALGDVKEYTAQERGFLNGVFAAGGFADGEYVQFLDIRAAKQAAVAAFERDATPDQRSRLDAAMSTDEAQRSADAENLAIAAEHGAFAQPVNPGDWWREMTSVVDGQRTVQRGIGGDIEHRAGELRRNAEIVLGLYLLAAALAVGAVIALVVATVSAIVRPLADLAEKADLVAGERLPNLIAAWQDPDADDPEPPEPVHLDESAGEEIVSVAHALDRVQATAYELASVQARLRRNTTESMANLARRNQNLVRRQLGLISDFEREELDPNALSNLFELDHLATRMRRNAESLLVLVGESSPRRWAEPIPLSDVIRAGLSEVDDYRRVVLRRVDEVSIAGAHVSEIAHMLAELIENGLSFSPPDLEVEIYGRRFGARYMVAVVDHGVGMPPDQLTTANARLSGEADFLVAPTRFLGHYVVGRLARRLDIEVELTVSPTTGVVARLLLPATLLADPGDHLPDLPEDAKHAATNHLSAADAMPEPTRGRHSSAQPAALDTVLDGKTSVAPPPRGLTVLTEVIAPQTSGATEQLGRPAARSASTPVKLVPPPEPNPFDDNGSDSSHAAESAPQPVPDSILGDPSAGDEAGRVPATIGSTRFDTIDLVPITDPGTDSGHGPARSGAAARADRTPAGPAADADSAVTQQLPAASRITSGVTGATGQGGQATGDGGANGAVVSAGVPEVQRTRNGLVKRTRKTREDSGAAPVAAPTVSGPPTAERSPDTVRNMLTGFRAGHQRGYGEPTVGHGGEPTVGIGAPGTNTQEEPR